MFVKIQLGDTITVAQVNKGDTAKFANGLHPSGQGYLGAFDGDATLDIAQGVGHELHPALVDSALFRLTSHIPHRTWRAALGQVPSAPER